MVCKAIKSNDMKKGIILAVIASLLFSGCFREPFVGLLQSKHSPVRVCYPSKRLLRKAETKYANHTPLNADDLRHLLMDDTTHYKIVVVYSYCCGPCHEAMPTVFVPLMKGLDTARCRMYFILDDCGSLPWNDDYLAHYGIATRYYMRDADTLFRWRMADGTLSNMQDWTNIVNYALQPRHAFTDCAGVPLTLVVSPDGCVKQVLEQYNNCNRMTAYDLRFMVRDSLSVYDLDFDRIDTVRYEEDWTIDDVDIPDTVAFRTYHPRRYCTPDGRCY